MSEPMSCSASVLLDSLSPDGHRLTTLELTLPRFLLAQLNTHRSFSRNAASSRAIPTAKLIEQVRVNPFVPAAFAANQRGMQAGAVLSDYQQVQCNATWRAAAEEACTSAEMLLRYGVHKQWPNRLLEPFLWVKVLVSATEWSNFFRLRCHDDAQPEFQQLAQAIFAAREASEPRPVLFGDAHLPYITEEEIDEEGPTDGRLCRWSVARCARLGHSTIEKDEELYERLLNGSGFGHWSPFEHVAHAIDDPHDRQCGNFTGWRQYRKTFSGECG